MTTLAQLRPGARFRLVHTQRTGTLKRLSPCAALVEYDGAARQVEIETAAGEHAEFTRAGRAITIALSTEVEVLA